MKILITGGAGFIGSHVVRRFVLNYPNYKIFNVDNLTYAGNLENLADIENYQNYSFIRGDITDKKFVKILFEENLFDGVIHLAAESHVDRSISDPSIFAITNILGTINLLDAFKNTYSKNFKNKMFYHISTDEVYGSLGKKGLFTEKTPYDPKSPYSASKASSDHFVRAYGTTFNIPYVISNCSNNYGEYQFPEKLIPLFINNIINKKDLPVYGNGENIRDWLYVKDHAAAIDLVFHNGKKNETYNIGGFNEWKNIDIIRLLCKKMDIMLERKTGSSEQLIKYIKDRPGHDKRYAIDSSKIKNELGWLPTFSFEKGLDITINWYLNNETWLKNVTSGKYLDYYDKQYHK